MVGGESLGSGQMRMPPIQYVVWTGVGALALLGAVFMTKQPLGEPCLAKYSTDLKSRTRNQRHNAVLAAQFLDGSVIGPGETLSFNKAVGSWSRDVGYRKAPVSYNGQLIPSWGGGVCQTSTTLYNAALLAGLQIVERSPHRFATGYCPPGRDAAVAFGGIDLKLKNPYEFPVRISTRTEHGALSVALYGLRSVAKQKVFTEIRDLTAPATFVANRERSRGHVRNSGKAGYEVATYRTTSGKRELISVDTYPVVHRIVEYR